MAQIHYEVAGDVCFGLKFLDVVLVGFGVNLPVDVLKVITCGVFSMFAELNTESMKRTGVQSVQKVPVARVNKINVLACV